MSSGPSNWTPSESDGKTLGTKRFKEDTEVLRSRLADQNFEMKSYPDPLQPRQTDGAAHFPKGVTKEMEDRWLEKIAAAKAS